MNISFVYFSKINLKKATYSVRADWPALMSEFKGQPKASDLAKLTYLHNSILILKNFLVTTYLPNYLSTYLSLRIISCAISKIKKYRVGRQRYK